MIYCLNSGSCIEGTNGSNAICLCPERWTGERCEADLCAEICLNGGFCLGEFVGEAGPMCTCLQGFTGERCEINSLNSSSCDNYCLNDGICIQIGGDDAVCLCVTGFTGERCEVNLQVMCDMTVPCINGGTCIEGISTGDQDRCQCLPGFGGDRCETDLIFCSQTSCANGSTCVDLIGMDTECLCPPGFTGSRCDINEGGFD